MTQLQIDHLSFVERVTQPTPKFFKVIRNVGVALTAVGGIITTAPVVLPATLVTAAGYMLVGGAVAAAISQFTVKS